MKIRNSENLISLNILKEYLKYDPKTGLWTWLKDNGKRGKAGEIAGCENNHGYVIITINGKRYSSNRLAWFYMTGEWPKELIDHKDTVKNNDKWENLREATRTENQRNRNVTSKSKSKIKGAYLVNGKYKSYICLGTFDTAEEAGEIYKKAALIFHKEFANFTESKNLK